MIDRTGRAYRGVVALFVSAALCAGASARSQQSDSGPAVFDRLQFRSIGPATASGRITDFAVLERDPNVFYVATPAGGLWKTVNNGATFDVLFDRESVSSIGCVAISQTDPNLVWVGTGEASNRQNSSWGDGAYKSTDAGRTWTRAGLAGSKHIARIAISRDDDRVVYVAAVGNLWAAGGERGVYRTTDGGRTWRRVLFVDDETGAVDLVMDPSNSRVLYAAMYQRRRAAWGFNGAGPGSGIFKTADGGDTWTPLTSGIPQGVKGRIGLDVFRKDPRILYARVEHPTEGGIYRSDDAGATWRMTSPLRPEISAYFGIVRVDPNDANRVYVPNVTLNVSEDGGKTFRGGAAEHIHPDLHALWIDPRDSRHLMLGGDGGAGISYDGGKSYVFLGHMAIGQFYHLSYDNRDPYWLCAGQQDSYTWCGPSATRSGFGIVNDDWSIVSGGDGLGVQIDPSDPNTIYAEEQNGDMVRTDRATNERKKIKPVAAAGEAELRWNWDTPLVLSPHDPATLFAASNRVHRSRNRGQSWETISPDLTTNTDRSTRTLMGVPAREFAVAANYGVRWFPTIVSFSESPKRSGIYWTGSDDGLLQVSRDDGAHWSDVSPSVRGVPAGAYVSEVVASRFDEATAYVTFDGHRQGTFAPFVYRTANYGATWRSIAGGLPDGTVVRTIAEDLRNSRVLYLGTEQGLFVSVDQGGRWSRLGANLPTVPIYEIALHPRENAMILATHGRSLWILDDLAPIQELEAARATDAFLFPPGRAAQRVISNNDRNKWYEGNAVFLGENPTPGVQLQYHLGQPAAAAEIVVRDRVGKVVRRLAADAERLRAGLNAMPWDLRLEPLPAKPALVQGSGRWDGARIGPLVLPGEYRATLSVGGRDLAWRPVVVTADPDIRISAAERESHFDTVNGLHDLQRAANDTAEAVRALYDEIKSAHNVSDLLPRVETLRRRLGVGSDGPDNVRGRIGEIKIALMDSTSTPTDAQRRTAADLRLALRQIVDEAQAARAEWSRLQAPMRERKE